MRTPSCRGLILLTGASGFVGSSFLESALKSGWRVRILARCNRKWMANANIEFSYGDFRSAEDWTRAVHGAEVVVNLAGETKDPSLMPVVNSVGPERLLQAAVNSGVSRWVQLSSVGAYGSVLSGLVSEDWPDHPSNPYERSKTDFDGILKRAAQDNRIEVCIVRPSNIYGPGMTNQSIQQLVNTIRNDLFAFIGPEGASANYVHVQDVVQALELCVRHPQAANQTYIVSAWATIEEMVSGLAAGLGLARPTRRVPLRVAILLARAMQWWCHWPLTLSRVKAMSVRSRYSTKKIEKELGWKLTVPVKEGMCEFAGDFRR